MTSRARAIVALLAIAGFAAGCGDGDAPRKDALAAQEAAEAAAMRGEPAAGSPADAAAATCARAGGQWNDGARTCGVTASLCAASAGSWEAGECTVAVEDEAGCSGFSGIRWTAGRCVIAHLDETELKHAGF